MSIVYDDCHSTAIVITAALLNALEVQGKPLRQAKIVCLGDDTAVMACYNLLQNARVPLANITLLDRKGVLRPERMASAGGVTSSRARDLDDVIVDTDVFLGVFGLIQLSPRQLLKMAPRPVVFACSTPDPEILPELAHQTRDDILVATARSDYPNQVTNELCSPFLLRGALDVAAPEINTAMKLAAVETIRALAKESVLDDAKRAHGDQTLGFGRHYILPKPTDPRLLPNVSSAVAAAAVESGVARLPYPDYYPVTRN